MEVLAEPLTDAQLRILGVLIEKQFATPQAYPLTENALLTACNQTTNRFPVVAYDTSVVRPALIRLRERGLAKRVRRPGERVEKHAHLLDEQLALSSPAPLAVLTVLMLRGAQTPGELRARCQRLRPIPDGQALDAALSELQDRGLAEPLPRRPGEKQVRWRQLLTGVDAEVRAEPTGDASAPSASPRSPRAASSATSSPATSPVAGSSASADLDGLTRRLEELTALVHRLQARVIGLERELGVEPPEHDT